MQLEIRTRSCTEPQKSSWGASYSPFHGLSPLLPMDHSIDLSISSLCSACSSIFVRANTIEEEIQNAKGDIMLPIGKPSYLHHQNLGGLKQSADEKCYICVRLWLQFNTKGLTTGQLPHDPNCLVDMRYSLTAKGLPDLARIINVWFMQGALTMAMPYFRRYVVMPTKG